MSHYRFLLLFVLGVFTATVSAQAPASIYAYAIGDWRDGPTVTISPLFSTTEAFTTPQLIARVKKDYPEFKDILDIDVQRFATTEEGELSRTTLRGKYLARHLVVNLMVTPADPAPPAPTPPAPERTK